MWVASSVTGWQAMIRLAFQWHIPDELIVSSQKMIFCLNKEEEYAKEHTCSHLISNGYLSSWDLPRKSWQRILHTSHQSPPNKHNSGTRAYLNKVTLCTFSYLPTASSTLSTSQFPSHPHLNLLNSKAHVVLG